MDYAAVIAALYPDARAGIDNNDYATLRWDESNTDPAPSQADLEAAWPWVKYDKDYAQVEQDRRAAYTIDADPLFFKWQRGTGTEQAWRDSVQAVKDAHPYPEPPEEKNNAGS
jgi:hypothetical protein